MAEDLIAFMRQLESTAPTDFTAPQIYYGAAEDSLTFYFRADESYAFRINDLITVFLSFEKNELVGCQIKGLKRKLESDGSLDIAIKKKGILELGLFFHLLAYEISDPEPRSRLVELGQRAKGVEMNTAEMVPC